MTVYSNEFGTVNYWEDERLKKIDSVIMQVSGGSDSTLQLYLACTEFMKLGIRPRILCQTLVAEEKFANALSTEEIVGEIQELFPELELVHHLGYYSEREEPIKKVPHNRLTAEMREEYGALLVVSSRTANPPEDIAEEHDLVDLRETIRDTAKDKPIMVANSEDEILWYGPFQYVDKRWVIQVYRDLGIEWLHLKTTSCIGWENETEYFTKACRKCWWCKEKLWAAGYYDLGELPDGTYFTGD